VSSQGGAPSRADLLTPLARRCAARSWRPGCCLHAPRCRLSGTWPPPSLPPLLACPAQPTQPPRRPSGLQLAGGGASVEELLRELQWLCEDAVSSWRAADAAERSPGDAWRTLQRSGALGSAGTAATLRASLHELKALWRSRLHDRQPFQYTVATAHWRDLVLAVGPGVLIPRPETEALVDFAEAALLAQPQLRHATWADAGTGSGALAVALSRLLPLDAPAVVALDVSPVPLAYATANAQRAGHPGRVVTMQGSWLAPLLLQRGRGCLGGLLSNPPYIPNQRLPALQPEVGRHEPHLALDGGGVDGADALRALVSDATQGEHFLHLRVSLRVHLTQCRASAPRRRLHGAGDGRRGTS